MVGDVPPGHDSANLLRRVCVRLIRPEERPRWDALVDHYHYLGLRSLFGKTLRYVAVAEERGLALLAWQAAALKCAARDAWIGWPRVLHYQRLHLLANHARNYVAVAHGFRINKLRTDGGGIFGVWPKVTEETRRR